MSTWLFTADALPDELRTRINEIGFLTPVRHDFYGVFLATTTGPSSSDLRGREEDDIEALVASAAGRGVKGLLVFAPYTTPTPYESIDSGIDSIGKRNSRDASVPAAQHTGDATDNTAEVSAVVGTEAERGD